jgi:restriction system protein
MGSIHLTREHLLETLIEVVGFKAGVVIGEDRLLRIVGSGSPVSEILDPNGPGGGRVRSEDVEEAVAVLLHAVGNTSSPHKTFSAIDMFHRYKRDPVALDTYMAVGELFGRWRRQAALTAPADKPWDATPFVFEATRLHGKTGMDMAMEMINGINRDLHQSPWTRMRTVDWADEIELRNLFESEGLQPSHGTFVDQRFIDYLHRNFDDVDTMNWRKFEGLAGEWFVREGFDVAMGSGRGDGGVDLRVHCRDAAPDAPALILVQCKRTKAKVDQGVVKAIYADVLHEGAGSGLIVTTSGLQPGAERMRKARGYNVEAADRAAIREWLARMRSGE